jgi:hypothetical protein
VSLNRFDEPGEDVLPLPELIRAGILTMIRVAGGTPGMIAESEQTTQLSSGGRADSLDVTRN